AIAWLALDARARALAALTCRIRLSSKHRSGVCALGDPRSFRASSRRSAGARAGRWSGAVRDVRSHTARQIMYASTPVSPSPSRAPLWIVAPALLALGYAIAVVIAAWQAPDKGFHAFTDQRVVHVEPGGRA